MAHSIVLTDAGAIFGFGSNELGWLGRSADKQQLVPTAIAGLDLGSASAVESVATGARHTVALLEDGQLRCLGSNAFGQLGDASAATRAPEPAVVLLPSV